MFSVPSLAYTFQRAWSGGMGLSLFQLPQANW